MPRVGLLAMGQQGIDAQSHSVALIRASAINPLIRQIEKRRSVRLLLSRHRLPAPDLDDGYSEIPLRRFVAFLEDAATELHDPVLGARLGAGFRPADIGPVGILCSLSPTIRYAFNRITRYVTSVQNETHSHLSEDGDALIWSYRISDSSIWPRRQDAEYSLTTTCQLMRTCFKASWKPMEVHFEHGPSEDTPFLQRFFRAPILFDQPSNRIVANREDIDRIYRVEDTELTSILERHIADLVRKSDRPESFTEKLQALIELYIGRRPISTELLAEELGISVRTLQRRLESEGANLRDILRNSRLKLANSQLHDGRLSIAEIAKTLGYVDAAAFCRAYKEWTGRPPSRGRVRVRS